MLIYSYRFYDPDLRTSLHIAVNHGERQSGYRGMDLQQPRRRGLEGFVRPLGAAASCHGCSRNARDKATAERF